MQFNKRRQALKYLIVAMIAVVMLLGCARFNMGVGIGYKKVPPDFKDSLFQPLSDTRLALTPVQIDLIIKILNSAGIKYLFPTDNMVELGVFFNISAENND